MFCTYVSISKCHACQSQPDFMNDKMGKYRTPNCKAKYYIALPNCVLTYVLIRTTGGL